MIPGTSVLSSGGAEKRANSGGPHSRTRTMGLHSTVLGQKPGQFGCPLVVTAAIDFGRMDPLKTIAKLMCTLGIEDPEALRAKYQTVDQPCICRPSPQVPAPHVKRGPIDEVLRCVLILGLSTGHVYDPARPVLLTRASLTRHLTLYAGEGFYA